MQRHPFSFSLVAALVAAAVTASAQPGSPANPGGLNVAMMQVFGKNAAFSAKADMKVSGPQDLSMPMEVAALDGKMRTSTDLSAIKGAAMPPQVLVQMKSMGMDLMVTIMSPGQKFALMIYPNMKAYVEAPVAGPSSTSSKEPKIAKTELAKETIEGHPTVKNKLMITDEAGKTTELTVWNATDLKDFPIKWEMTEGGALITITYRDIINAKPDAKLFDVPSGFTKYGTMQEMVMEKMMKNGPPK